MKSDRSSRFQFKAFVKGAESFLDVFCLKFVELYK